MGKPYKGMMKESGDDKNFHVNHFEKVENQGVRRQCEKYKGNNESCLNSFASTVEILENIMIVNARSLME